jgi:exosome complex component RRP42
MSLTPTEPINIIPRLKAETIASIVKKGVRLDGRKLDEFRELTIIPNYLPKAQGSALVKLGSTQVLVGVKLEVGTPYPDAPDEGVIIVSAEFVPMASPVFEPGPPDENSIELARVIDRSIRETHAIDLKKLAIVPGKKVWTVWIDIYVLDHGGNLMDASSIGTLAALMTTRIPKAEVGENEEVLVDKATVVEPLPLNKKVVTVTLGKISNVLIVDPDNEEESVLDTKLTIAVTDDGLIAGIQKSGQSSITEEEALKAAEVALEKGKELIDKVTQLVETSARGVEHNNVVSADDGALTGSEKNETEEGNKESSEENAPSDEGEELGDSENNVEPEKEE